LINKLAVGRLYRIKHFAVITGIAQQLAARLLLAASVLTVMGNAFLTAQISLLRGRGKGKKKVTKVENKEEKVKKK